MGIPINRASYKDHFQKACNSNKEDDFATALQLFQDDTIKKFEQSLNEKQELEVSKKQKERGPFMKVKDFSNEANFRSSFAGSSNQKMSIGDFGKGLLLNQWSDDSSLQLKKVDGSVIAPTSILSDIIYSASEHSVLLGNCPILPMEEGKVLVGKVKDDVEPEFKDKYEEGKNTNLGLEGITLEAKTLYAYVVIAEEDLQDIKNLDTILRKSFSMAIAKALDNNFLYTNQNASTKPRVYPKGILDNPNINRIIVPNAGYDMVARANLEIAKANGKANTIGFNPAVNYTIQTYRDTIGQYINPPSFYNDLTKIESNALKPTDVIVFDSSQVLIGIRQEMDIKVMPELTNGTVVMRCMLRADVVATREDHICKITIEENTNTDNVGKKSKTK